MNDTFQVELIELKASYQHQMDLIDGLLQSKHSDLLEFEIEMGDIVAARRRLVLQAINRFEGICEKHGANPEASNF